MKKSLTYAAAGMLAAGLLAPAAQAVGNLPTFCVLPNGQPGQILHCDKIVFELKPKLAEELILPAKRPLDIKVCDDGTQVTDLKAEVIRFFGDIKVTPEVLKLVKINDVEYAIVCNVGVD